ncbi:MAG: hypothetical protein WCI95_10965, partial [bacterium]
FPTRNPLSSPLSSTDSCLSVVFMSSYAGDRDQTRSEHSKPERFSCRAAFPSPQSSPALARRNLGEGRRGAAFAKSATAAKEEA